MFAEADALQKELKILKDQQLKIEQKLMHERDLIQEKENQKQALIKIQEEKQKKDLLLLAFKEDQNTTTENVVEVRKKTNETLFDMNLKKRERTYDERNEESEKKPKWISKQNRSSEAISMHKECFIRINKNIVSGFRKMHDELQILEKELHSKLEKIGKKQYHILQDNVTENDELVSFENNIRAIDCSLEKFHQDTDHLSCIQSCIDQAKDFVHPNKHIATLVTIMEEQKQRLVTYCEICNKECEKGRLCNNCFFGLPSCLKCYNKVAWDTKTKAMFQYCYKCKCSTPMCTQEKPKLKDAHNCVLCVGDSIPTVYKVYIRNLPLISISYELFTPYGKVLYCYLPFAKGYGYVGYSSRNEAQAAVDGLHGFEMDGCFLHVSRYKK